MLMSNSPMLGTVRGTSFTGNAAIGTRYVSSAVMMR
jgi:hypothetical protein